jgi:hypothetical protein
MIKKLVDFRLIAPKIMIATDPESGQDYIIGWCGNGPYSHYTLSNADNREIGQYVFIPPHGRAKEHDSLYWLIYDAEMRLVYCVKSGDNYVLPEN